jgi:predicted alpha/beta hydrolase
MPAVQATHHERTLGLSQQISQFVIGHFQFFRHRFAESLWGRHQLPEMG